MKIIEVNVSQCLSTTCEIKVPDDMIDYDPEILKEYVKEQVTLPSDCIGYDWIVDDFSVL